MEDHRNIERDTLDNTDYRRVVHTVQGAMQIVLMSLEPGETIPRETHETTTQFIRVEAGQGVAFVRVSDEVEQVYALGDGNSIVIPPGAEHEVVNSSRDEPLKLYTIYCPPEHAPNLVQERQRAADETGRIKIVI